ncbi:unnamed protein product [Lasius platythorax]|uniref:Uncharacterized protein n=1 Tax=Lasius platythorax TaxID=488582 RepID=A0AAV2NCD0_9HYME
MRATSWRGATKPLDWQDEILESTNGKNLRGKLCGAPRWEFHGGIRKGEKDRHGGANENSFAFGENERERVQCVQGLSVIGSSRALPESIWRNK